MVSFGLAGDNKKVRGLSPEFLEQIRAEQQLDLAMPAQSARLLSELVTNHCKSDKATVTVKEEKDGLATLTIRGEQAHIAIVAKFALLLKGELLTAEEELAQQQTALEQIMKEAVPRLMKEPVPGTSRRD
jgi:hypothetical protein